MPDQVDGLAGPGISDVATRELLLEHHFGPDESSLASVVAADAAVSSMPTGGFTESLICAWLGMIAATVLAIFIVPVLYVIVAGLGERWGRHPQRQLVAPLPHMEKESEA